MLDRLVNPGVLSMVEFCFWGHRSGCEQGSVRICGEFIVTINPLLEDDKYPLPKIDMLAVMLKSM